MVLAGQGDVEARLRRPLKGKEIDDLGGLLVEASALVEAYCEQEFTSPVPRNVTLVTSRMVARLFTPTTVDAGVESVQLTSETYSATQRFSADRQSGSPWLSKQDKLLLRKFRVATGAFNVSLLP